ncbi:MAG: sortase [Candidatus Pacebacteria bacterium]|nr:sortase [Candidatus Paceibacterota bacterium]
MDIIRYQPVEKKVESGIQFFRLSRLGWYVLRSFRESAWLPRISTAAGRGLVLFSFAGLLLGYFPVMALEVQQEVKKTWLKPPPVSISSLGKLLEKYEQETQEKNIQRGEPADLPAENLPDREKQFQLEIPAIRADSCVRANVDPVQKSAYAPALGECVAHAKGSGLPGEENAANKTVYLFAHSTNAPYNILKYNAVFYALKDLKIGDEITLWFWGKRFAYRVEKMEIRSAKDTSYFVPQTERDQLVLQTCYPPGTTLKQLLVIAKPIGF